MDNQVINLRRLALGTVQFGLDYGISNLKGQTSLVEVDSILNKALSAGIETIDTANAYGNSEAVLGNCNLASFNIISKFPPSIQTVEALHISLEASLGNLKKTSLYGYLAHDADGLLVNPCLWQEMLALKVKGKVKKVGYSLYTPTQLEQLLSLNFIPDIIQVPYNLLDRRFEQYFEHLKSLGCEIHVRSAFLQGLFFLNPENIHTFFEPIKPLLRELQEKLKDQSSIAGYLLSFVLNNEQVDKLVFGVNNLAQLESNIHHLQFSNKEVSIVFNDWVDENILMPNKWPK